MKNIPNKQISGCQHTTLEMSLLDEKFISNMKKNEKQNSEENFIQQQRQILNPTY